MRFRWRLLHRFACWPDSISTARWLFRCRGFFDALRAPFRVLLPLLRFAGRSAVVRRAALMGCLPTMMVPATERATQILPMGVTTVC